MDLWRTQRPWWNVTSSRRVLRSLCKESQSSSASNHSMTVTKRAWRQHKLRSSKATSLGLSSCLCLKMGGQPHQKGLQQLARAWDRRTKEAHPLTTHPKRSSKRYAAVVRVRMVFQELIRSHVFAKKQLAAKTRLPDRLKNCFLNRVIWKHWLRESFGSIYFWKSSKGRDLKMVPWEMYAKPWISSLVRSVPYLSTPNSSTIRTW